MFKFHRDKFGIWVYYPQVNKEYLSTLKHGGDQLFINDGIRFDVGVSAVVPAVQTVYTEEHQLQIVHYTDSKGFKIMPHSYDAMLMRLQKAIHHAMVAENQSTILKTKQELADFENEWSQVKQNVAIRHNHPFEVIDIQYPADDRIFPIRHYDESKIDYFTVNGDQVAIKLIKSLCEERGLAQSKDRYDKSHAFYVPKGNTSWEDATCSTIGGSSFTNELGSVPLHREFVGSLEECRDYINRIESACRRDFDCWLARSLESSKLTIGFVVDGLDRIESMVKNITFKVASRDRHEYTLQAIREMRNKVRAMGIQEIRGETENLVDN